MIFACRFLDWGPKNGAILFDIAVMQAKPADEMANSVGPDQTAPKGAV